LNLLINLQKTENKTLIIVTHDEKIAKRADRIAVLSDGQVVKIIKNKK